MYAIYARQSVERKESISIEMQVEMCMKCVPVNEEYSIFEDRGYSGTNTKRPAFKEMMKLAEEGKFCGMIVYKLDRISRSLCDFASIWESLEKRKIELISCTEGIDSTTAMGQMLIKLLIMFAEMEQRNISARIRDNYLARAEKMLPLGGKAPIGYNADWTIEPKCSKIVESCFLLAAEGKSLDEIGRSIGLTGTKIARMIRNPVYVKLDEYVIKRLKNEGYKLLGEIDDYKKGCGFHGITSAGEKYIAPSNHKGIIAPELFLAARDNLLNRKPSSNGGSGKLSWVQGRLICGKCGESCYVRDNGKGRPYLYVTCQGKRKGVCTGLHGIRVESVERRVWNVLTDEVYNIVNSEKEDAEIEKSTEIPSYSPDDNAEKILLLEREKILQNRKIKKNLPFQRLNKKMLKELPDSAKKSICSVLVKNIVITEEKYTLILL